MKKFFPLLLCLLLLFSCSAQARQTFDPIGLWLLTAAEENGLQRSVIEKQLPDMAIELCADGTSRITSVQTGFSSSGTWQMTGGTVSVTGLPEGAETVFTPSGDSLVCEKDGMRLHFTRHLSYCGTWTLRFAIANNSPIPLEKLGTDMTIILRQDGSCAVRSMGRTLHGVWSETENGVSITANEMPISFVFENGMLIAKDKSLSLCVARDIGVCSDVPKEAFAGRWDLIDAYIYDVAYTEEALAEALTFILDENGEVSRKSAAKEYGSNRLTWSAEEIPGLGTVLNIREHYANGDYDDFEVYMLENGLLKLWNSEARYQLYQPVDE